MTKDVPFVAFPQTLPKSANARSMGTHHSNMVGFSFFDTTCYRHPSQRV